MAQIRKEMNEDKPDSRLLRAAKVLFIVFFTVILFLLIKTMVHHHFFSGGQLNKHDATGP